MKHVFLIIGCVVSFLLEIFYPDNRSINYDDLPKKNIETKSNLVILKPHDVDSFLLRSTKMSQLNTNKLFHRIKTDSIK